MENNIIQEKICKQCGRLLPIDMFHKSKGHKDGHKSVCKDCASERKKVYYNENKQRYKEYYQNNRDEKISYQKEYIRNHYDEHKLRTLKWWREHPEAEKAKQLKRIALKNNVNGDFTAEQWIECLQFFNNTCAYSGETFTEEGNGKVSADHIVPLNSKGDGYIWNIVPAKLGYNSSKGKKDMKTWYLQQPYYSESRLNMIYEWQIYAYQKWGDSMIAC